ncbi:MAG: tyrosine-type recombinase/integrase [Nitrososphaeria archaeon]|nr:tyrosine-type recombinase/integrase [Nitrososphaeria archaeon]
MQFNHIENWLSAVGFACSNSENTDANYRVHFKKFLAFIGKNAEEIVEEYEGSSDRKFRRRYAQLVKAFLRHLQSQGYSSSTVAGAVATVKSFFKYSDLPLGFVPSFHATVEFPNRDITKEEILEILGQASVRDRAFFTIMCQSGLRPGTIANLKIEDIENILDKDTPIPCRIVVKEENTKGGFMDYFTFIGKDGVDALKAYLIGRNEQLTRDSYLFAKHGHNKPVSPGVLTHTFRRIADRLKRKGLMDFKKEKKNFKVENEGGHDKSFVSRSTIRLYNLRKWFRKQAGHAGPDFVNFWMGHTSALDVDLHYFSRDVEHHKKQYSEKALPYLRLYKATPSETEKTIQSQAEEIAELKRERSETEKRLTQLEKTLESMAKQLQSLTEEKRSV